MILTFMSGLIKESGEINTKVSVETNKKKNFHTRTQIDFYSSGEQKIQSPLWKPDWVKI